MGDLTLLSECKCQVTLSVCSHSSTGLVNGELSVLVCICPAYPLTECARSLSSKLHSPPPKGNSLKFPRSSDTEFDTKMSLH